MEKLKKQSKLFSIIGGIIFAILAFSVLLDYFTEIFIYQIPFSFKNFFRAFFNLVPYAILFVFLFMNKANKWLIISPIIELILLFISIVEAIYIVDMNYAIVNIFSYLCTLLLSISIILIICFATSKKTKIINSTWFIPFVICIFYAVYVIYNSLKTIYTFSDIFILNFETARSAQYIIYLNIKEIIMQLVSITAFLMLGLWLKTKNGIFLEEQPQIAAPIQPMYYAPIQPQVERHVAPQQSVQPQFDLDSEKIERICYKIPSHEKIKTEGKVLHYSFAGKAKLLYAGDSLTAFDTKKGKELFTIDFKMLRHVEISTTLLGNHVFYFLMLTNESFEITLDKNDELAKEFSVIFANGRKETVKIKHIVINNEEDKQPTPEKTNVKKTATKNGVEAYCKITCRSFMGGSAKVVYSGGELIIYLKPLFVRMFFWGIIWQALAPWVEKERIRLKDITNVEKDKTVFGKKVYKLHTDKDCYKMVFSKENQITSLF